MLKTRKAVCQYSILEHKMYANFFTAVNETFEIKQWFNMTKKSQSLIFIRSVALANKDLRDTIDDIDSHLEAQYIIEELALF